MSLVDLRMFCNWLDLDEDNVNSTLVDMVTDTAQALCEHYCDRKFDNGTFTEYHDITDTRTSFIYVRNPPIISVTSLTDDAQDSTPDTIDSDEYILSATAGKIQLDNTNQSFPTVYPGYFTRGDQSVCVVYVGGYTAVTAPAGLRLAVLQQAAFFWNNRDQIGIAASSVDGESVTPETAGMIPGQVRMLLGPYRRLTA